MMNGPEKSDSAIRAMKPANKAGQPAAEWAEQRAGTKGNAGQPHTRPTQSRGSVSQGLDRVRHVCRQTPKVGAVCPNRARTDLCGGRRAISVPTAISAPRSRGSASAPDQCQLRFVLREADGWGSGLRRSNLPYEIGPLTGPGRRLPGPALSAQAVVRSGP
jgi:hypothetical protein